MEGVYVGKTEGWLNLGELVGTEDIGFFVGFMEGNETVGGEEGFALGKVVLGAHEKNCVGSIDGFFVGSAEGFVFDYDGNSYKFTGNFAPVNQLLGLFRYGRGNVPPMQITEEDSDVEDKSNRYICYTNIGFQFCLLHCCF